MISRSLLRVKVLQILYANFNSGEAGIANPGKELMFSIQKTYDLYYYILLLMVAVKRHAETRIELARSKKLPTYEDLHPNTRFIENEVIGQVEKSIEFNRYVKDHGISWVKYPELIKNLYGKLMEAPYYKEYMALTACNYAADRKLLADFYGSELEECDMFYDILEEQSIFWNGDVEYAVYMAVRTIMDMRPSRASFLPMFRTDEDRDFALALLRTSIAHHDEYRKLIENYIDNWDVERVVYMDNLIMQMAINELTEFPSIPVKVTFDEYLELSKYYSTAKSSVFINGLLDKLVADMTAQGKVVKTGRGLLNE